MGRPSDVVTSGLLLVASIITLSGAFVFPFLHAEFQIEFPVWLPEWLGLHERLREWLIAKGRISEGDQFLWDIIAGLFRGGEYALGVAITLFSIVFPSSKIALAGIVLAGEKGIGCAQRARIVGWLQMTGRWSMADVFVIAIVVVFFKAEGFHFRFHAGPGLYCYGGSALLSALAVGLVSRAAVQESS